MSDKILSFFGGISLLYQWTSCVIKQRNRLYSLYFYVVGKHVEKGNLK